MAHTIDETGKVKIRTNEYRPCPAGFVKKNGKCVQAGVGPEYKP